MNETQAIAFYKKKYPAGKYYKLHGGRFQSCLPDIIHIINGKTYFYEFKIVDKTTIPWAKMRLGQHVNMLTMLQHISTVWYMVYSKLEKCFYKVEPRGITEGKPYEMMEDERIL